MDFLGIILILAVVFLIDREFFVVILLGIVGAILDLTKPKRR